LKDVEEKEQLAKDARIGEAKKRAELEEAARVMKESGLAGWAADAPAAEAVDAPWQADSKNPAAAPDFAW
jgi:hypothetical protein